VPTSVDLEFNFYVEPLVQSQRITDRAAYPWKPAERLRGRLDTPLRRTTHLICGGGLIETDGAQKPGYAAWKAG
jgi:hypothetical protein